MDDILELAKSGIVEAQYVLGLNMYKGTDGFTQNKDQGWNWLYKAAKAGHSRANFTLGCILYIDGKHDERVQAVYWFMRSADRGYAPANWVLGVLYLTGQGVARDLVTAAKYIDAALSKGLDDQNQEIMAMILKRHLDQIGESNHPELDLNLLDHIGLLGELNPPRTKAGTSKIERDTQLVAFLKRQYDDKCQVCNNKLDIGMGDYYSEVHHIQPLGRPHNGPDVAQNMIVVCPDHHAMFDRGAISINLSNKTVVHRNPENPLNGLPIRLKHRLDPKYLEYHEKYIFMGR